MMRPSCSAIAGTDPDAATRAPRPGNVAFSTRTRSRASGWATAGGADAIPSFRGCPRLR